MRKHSSDKRDAKIVKGLQISWTDNNPLDDTPILGAMKVSHFSPVWRPWAAKIWERSAPRILQTVYSWHVKVTVVFRSNRDGKDFHIVGDFRARYAHNTGNGDMNDAIERFIFEAKLNNQLVIDTLGADNKSAGEYLRTEFLACIEG